MSDKPKSTLTKPEREPLPPLDPQTVEVCAKILEGRADTLSDPVRYAECCSCVSALRKLAA